MAIEVGHNVVIPLDVSPSAVTATGSTTARFLKDRFADVVNVKDFGATGNGTTDDTGAIQAALNFAMPTGKEVFVPSGTYLITSSLVIGHASTQYLVRIRGQGYSSKFTANFSGYVLDRSASVSLIVEGPHYIDDLYIANSHASGSGINFVGFVGGRLSGLRIEAKSYGIFAWGNAFSLIISGCRILGTGTGYGIASGGVTILDCDIVGWAEGVRIGGVGVAIVGGRYEVNGIGILLGKTPAGADYATTRVSITGVSMEANDIAIDLPHVGYTFIGGVGIQGSTNAPSGQSQYGIRILGAGATIISTSGTSGSFSNAAIYIANGFGAMGQLSFISVLASNTYGGASKVWDAANNWTTRFIACDNDAPPDRNVIGIANDRGDASATLLAGTDAPIQRWATVLGQNRTVTLNATANKGDNFRIVRTGLGAFTLDVGPGLKTIPNATAAFVDVTYDGSAWVLTGYGTL